MPSICCRCFLVWCWFWFSFLVAIVVGGGDEGRSRLCRGCGLLLAWPLAVRPAPARRAGRWRAGSAAAPPVLPIVVCSRFRWSYHGFWERSLPLWWRNSHVSWFLSIFFLKLCFCLWSIEKRLFVLLVVRSDVGLLNAGLF